MQIHQVKPRRTWKSWWSKPCSCCRLLLSKRSGKGKGQLLLFYKGPLKVREQHPDWLSTWMQICVRQTCKDEQFKDKRTYFFSSQSLYSIQVVMCAKCFYLPLSFLMLILAGERFLYTSNGKEEGHIAESLLC